MHIFLRTGYTKTYRFLVMGPAVPREHECVWANVTRCQSITTRNNSHSQEKKQNRPGCFVIKTCSLFLLTCLLFLPPRLTWSRDARHTNTFLLPQFHYLTGPVGTFLLAQEKGTNWLLGIMELTASWRIQSVRTTGTEVFKLSEAQWRSLYHTGISFILRQAIKYAFLKNA